MKLLIQRVKKASVLINKEREESINEGLLVFIGIGKNDKKEDINYMINKMLNLRIFEENNKMNLSIKDINKEILLISQFTLYANTKKGNRPSFENAKEYNKSKKIYDDFIKSAKEIYPKIKTGEFGAKMEVSLINDGPVTIMLD